MAVKVTEESFDETDLASGRYIDVKDGHLFVRGAFDPDQGTNPITAIYSPGKWVSAQVTPDGASS